jgi:hypothetical protein
LPHYFADPFFPCLFLYLTSQAFLMWLESWTRRIVKRKGLSYIGSQNKNSLGLHWGAAKLMLSNSFFELEETVGVHGILWMSALAFCTRIAASSDLPCKCRSWLLSDCWTLWPTSEIIIHIIHDNDLATFKASNNDQVPPRQRKLLAKAHWHSSPQDTSSLIRDTVSEIVLVMIG